MTEEQCNSNKLIAEFMGFNPNPVGIYRIEGVPWHKGGYYLETMKYNSSWDWLMTVVEKIEEIPIEDDNLTIKIHRFIVETPLTLCEIYDTVSNELIGSGDHGSKILSTYNAVVEFIEWYNKNR